MSLFQVLVPANVEGQDALGETVLVSDRFSWGAALLTPFWAMMHGLWLELLVWIVAMIGLGAAGLVIGDDAVFGISILVGILIGFEAGAIRAAALKRRGFRPAGDVVAPSLDMAEMEWIRRGSAA